MRSWQILRSTFRKRDEQVQFAAYEQYCDDTSVEKKRAMDVDRTAVTGVLALTRSSSARLAAALERGNPTRRVGARKNRVVNS